MIRSIATCVVLAAVFVAAEARTLGRELGERLPQVQQAERWFEQLRRLIPEPVGEQGASPRVPSPFVSPGSGGFVPVEPWPVPPVGGSGGPPGWEPPSSGPPPVSPGSGHRWPPETGENIAAWSNFIRYNPHDPRAERNFRAIVRAASRPGEYEMNLEAADLLDIETAQYDEQTGELILIGPRIRDWDGGHLPPLLLLDDFAMALRVLDTVGERALGVSIGTHGGRMPTRQEMERARREGRVPIEYIPALTAGTHMGFALFEADRWLKSLSKGRDTHTLQPMPARVQGYRPLPDLMRPYLADLEEGHYSRYWFLPDQPQVAYSGHTMKFVGYRMTVQAEAYQDDPAVGTFQRHMTNNFERYCHEYPVFQELVRLHKLVQVAKWYRASGFPDDALVDYNPIPIPTLEYTREIRATVGRVNVPGGYREMYLTGGVDFSGGNVYLPAEQIPQTALKPGARPQTREFRVPAAPGPPRYGTFDGPVPLPAFVAPIVQARPAPTARSWTVRIHGRILKVVAIPVTREAMARGVRESGAPASAFASAAPRATTDHAP